ncbi:MAG: phytanoyl-CoA dioxygenase family protein [Pseudomonadota bacterium]
MDALSKDSGRYRLDDREIDDYFAIGWITKKALFSENEVARILECFDNLERTAAALRGTGPMDGSHFVLGEKAGQQIIKRVVWAGGCQPYLLEIGADPRLTLPASQLLGSAAMEQLLCQAHFKRPGDGVVFGWHQDIQHRDKGNGTWRDVNGSGSFVQTLIVLDPMTADGGPLKFIPGSSTWGPVDFGEHDYDDPSSTRTSPPQFDESEAVTVLAEPGDTLFFGPYTAHASFENTSPKYRRVLINGFAFPGANHREYPGDGAGRRLTL